MTLLQTLIIAFAVSIDGFWGGFAFGLKGSRFRVSHIFLLGCCTLLLCTIAMLAAHLLGRFLNIGLAVHIGAALLFGLGIYILVSSIIGYRCKDAASPRKEKNKAQINAPGAGINGFCGILLLGFAVAADASAATFTVSLTNRDIFIPLYMMVMHMVTIFCGNTLAMRKKIQKHAGKVFFLPGTILVALAIIRLF